MRGPLLLLRIELIRLLKGEAATLVTGPTTWPATSPSGTWSPSWSSSSWSLSSGNKRPLTRTIVSSGTTTWYLSHLLLTNTLSKTNHLIYSILNVSSFIFTRNSRCTLWLSGSMIQMLIEAILFRKTQRDDWLMMLAFAFVAVAISKVFQFLLGMFLYNDYQL